MKEQEQCSPAFGDGGVAGSLLPTPWQLSGGSSRAGIVLLTPVVTAATSGLREEMESSCSGHVSDEKAPAVASQHLSWTSLGGQECREPVGPKLEWDKVRAILFPCWEQQGREGSQYFQPWLLCLITAVFSSLVWQEEQEGAANNGCSHFPAVRYLKTLTPQPLIFFFLILLLFFSLARPAEGLPAASSTQVLIAALPLLGTPLCCMPSGNTGAASW